MGENRFGVIVSVRDSGEAATCPHLSVVVPCFNEEARIGPSLERLDAWLRANLEEAYEIVVVDDGSTDGTAGRVALMETRMPSLRVIRTHPNRGKGSAVRTGMLSARGRLRIFTDADLATPPEEIGPMLDALARAPVVIGTRVQPDGTDMRVFSQTPARRLLGRVFTLVASLIVGFGIKDTQCGFKGFTADAAETIFSRLRTEGYVFDVEVLCLARRVGCGVVQMPVRWRDPGGSRLQARPSLALRTLGELWRLWWRLRG